MWSSISSPMRLLMAPRAAARRCSTSVQGSSWFKARSTASSCPTIFFVRVTRSSFSLDKWDIFLDYPMGVWYHRFRPQRKTAERKLHAWNFQCKNRNLRVLEPSRNSTAREHSTSHWIRVFARTLEEMTARADIPDRSAKIPSKAIISPDMRSSRSDPREVDHV